MEEEEEKAEEPEFDEGTGEITVNVSPGISGNGDKESGEEEDGEEDERETDEEEEDEEDLQEIVLFLQLEFLRPHHDVYDTVNRCMRYDLALYRNYGLEQDYNLQHRAWTQPALPRVSATALGDFKFLLTTENKEGILLFDRNTTTSYRSVVEYLVEHAPANKAVLRDLLLSREYYPEESTPEEDTRNKSFLLPTIGSPQQGCLLLCVIDGRLEDTTVMFTRLSNPLKGALSASVRFVFVAAGPEHEKDKCLELCHACAAIMCDSRFVAKIYDLDAAGFRQTLNEEVKEIVLAPNLKLTSWFKNNLYTGMPRTEVGVVEAPQHLFTQLDEYRPQARNVKWHQNLRHWNFGLEQERRSVAAWKKPRLPVMDVWSVVQLTLALDEYSILFDVSPTTAASSTVEDSSFLTLRCIVVSALDRLEEMDRISEDDHHTAKHAFLERVADGVETLPVANSVLSPSRAQEGLLCLVGTADIRTPVITFARLTCAVSNLLTERECPVRFLFLLLLPSNTRNRDARQKLALKLGKSFADMFCDEKLMNTALTCVSAAQFLEAFNDRISNLSIVRVTSMENHRVLKNPEVIPRSSRMIKHQNSGGLSDSVFNATEFYTKESKGESTGRYVRRRGASMSSYDSDRSLSRSLRTSFAEATKTSFLTSTSVERERDDIEQLFVSKLTKDVQSKRRRYRWDLHHLPTLSRGCSLSNLTRWLVKYSLPLLLGVILGMVLSNLLDVAYFNAITHSRAGPFLCLPGGNPNLNITVVDAWWGNAECWRLFGLPVTLNMFVNDMVMCFYFAIAASHLREITYESPVKVKTAAVAALGGICGSILVYFIVLLTAFNPTSPAFRDAKDGWAVGTISSAPLTWLVGMAAYGRRHSAVTLIVLISIFTEGFALVSLTFFYGRPAQPFDALYLVAIVAGVAVTLGLRFVLHINWYAPYIIFGGGLSWVGCALSGIYPGLALIPIIAFMPREVLLFNSYPYVFFQWVTGQLSVMNVQDRHPRGSILQPRLRRSTMSRSHISKSHDRTSFSSQRSEIGFIMQPEERFNRCCQGDRYRAFKGALVRFEHDFEFPVQYMLFFFGIVAANIRFELLLDAYGSVIPFNSGVFLAVYLSSFIGKVIGIPLTLAMGSRAGVITTGLDTKDTFIVALTCTISLTIAFIIAERGFRKKVLEIEAKLAVLLCGLTATGLMVTYALLNACVRKIQQRSRARIVRKEERQSSKDTELSGARSFEQFETILKEEKNQDLADVIAEFLERKLKRRQIRSRSAKKSKRLRPIQESYHEAVV